MSTAALLLQYQKIKSDLNYYTLQQIYYSTKQDASAAQVTRWTKKEDAWEKAFDEVMNTDSDKTKKLGGNVFHGGNEADAERYADLKVGYTQEAIDETLLECSEEDTRYDAMQAMFETYQEKAKQEAEAVKNQLQTSAQESNTLNQ